MSRNLIYISYKLDSRVSSTARQVLDCLLTFGDQTIDAAINIYPSNQTIAERLNMSTRTIIRGKNELEELGIIVRYYDDIKNKELIKVPFAKLDEYMRDKSEAIEVTNCPKLETIEVTNCHQEVTKCHTTLHRPFLYNKGKYKKSEEEPTISSASYTPLEQVRTGSLCDPGLVRTEEQKATAIYWLQQIRTNKNH